TPARADVVDPQRREADRGLTLEEPSLDAQRGQLVRRVLLSGLGVAVAGAVVLGLSGGDGANSLAAVGVGSALAFGVASLVGLVTALVDEWRGHRVPRRRIVVAVVHLF